MADAVLYGIHLFLLNHISVDRQIGQNDAWSRKIGLKIDQLQIDQGYQEETWGVWIYKT